MAIDNASVIRKVRSVEEARSLPLGSIVGDLHGGVTFPDDVALALERRSHGGWVDLPDGSGTNRWTIIVINR